MRDASPWCRARELGIRFSGTPGAWNAVTDVRGVEVGHSTLIEGVSVRTGVTAIWPNGRQSSNPVFGAWYALNGNGELTGSAWIDESGFIDGPILLTNTHSVGVVRDAYIRWLVAQGRSPATNVRSHGEFWALPVVAEAWDGVLNDINGFHVRDQHVIEALESAVSGAVPEGSVGAGTGMISYGFKAGIGTSSRIVRCPDEYTVGVMVLANCGERHQLTIAGVPVGRELAAGRQQESAIAGDTGSIVIVVATDAPLLPHQARRLAKRAAMGLARTGSTAANGSGDLFVAFSTANLHESAADRPVMIAMLPNQRLDELFTAVVEATEEAIVNSLTAAQAMTGLNGRRIESLPLDVVAAHMRRFQ
jgi:D-aminopeptidase